MLQSDCSMNWLLQTMQSGRQQVMPDDHSEVVPLLPIPNRTVKRLCADDSAGSRVKVGHRQALTATKGPAEMLGLLFFRARLLRGRSSGVEHEFAFAPRCAGAHKVIRETLDPRFQRRVRKTSAGAPSRNTAWRAAQAAKSVMRSRCSSSSLNFSSTLAACAACRAGPARSRRAGGAQPQGARRRR